MEKVRFQREYILNVSRSILFNCLSTPSGMSEWFADDVNIKDDVFTFFWDSSEEQARLIAKKREEFVRFRWLELEDEGHECFFELRIRIDALTGETALIVTDYADEDELDEGKLLWDSQIENLKRILGS
ncbi:MAG: START-like domain-containing protein [Flavobacteriales bacterium]|jgi:uncharacterized protein YndB with AHSA1/START domain